MITRSELISDIELRIYQGKPSDDSELSRSQIGHWIDSARGLVLAEKINKDLSKGLQISPLYVEKEDCIPLESELSDCNGSCYQGRFYIEMESEIMTLYKDMGLIRIVDNYGRSLIGTDQNFSEILSDLPYVGTSNSRQTYFREKKRIFISKNSKNSMPLYKYTVFFIRDGVDNLDDTMPYPIEESLIPIILEEVEKIARRQMIDGVSDMDNDGTDPYNAKN